VHREREPVPLVGNPYDGEAKELTRPLSDDYAEIAGVDITAVKLCGSRHLYLAHDDAVQLGPSGCSVRICGSGPVG
jgi:hypothetical protein